MSGSSLLEVVQGLLERTYLMHTGVADVGRFVIGDAGVGSLYGSREAVSVGHAATGGARTFVRHTETAVRACIYYPDALVQLLESQPPQQGLHDANVEAFATLVEELDHLLLIAERSHLRRPLTLFELELHANVSKHLVLSRFAAGRRARLDERRRLWLHRHLFDGVRYCDAQREVRERYRLAARWAVKFIGRLSGMSGGERRVLAIRRFHRADVASKLAWVSGAAGLD